MLGNEFENNVANIAHRVFILNFCGRFALDSDIFFLSPHQFVLVKLPSLAKSHILTTAFQ